MQILNLKLKNFRNYDNLYLEFSPYMNILYGKNGTGKTNIVEAIYYLAITKSFRVKNDNYLIKKECISTTVSADVKTDDITNYKITLKENGKKTEIDQTKLNRISDYISRINVILFNPNDTNIIVDSPSLRRKMLNIEISQIYNDYLLNLSAYDKVLKHRNAYLKQLYINGSASKDYLDILTKKLVSFGMKIRDYRMNFICDINDYISQIYSDIFQYGELKVKYISNYGKKNEDEILELYRNNYYKEIQYGKTLYGIHHDDVEFNLDGNKIKDYGSVGQIKNAIISFRLAEIIIIEKRKKEYPILILDDLFSELDQSKIKNILTMLNNYVQTFITTTEVDQIDFSNFKEYKLFNIDEIKEALHE